MTQLVLSLKIIYILTLGNKTHLNPSDIDIESTANFREGHHQNRVQNHKREIGKLWLFFSSLSRPSLRLVSDGAKEDPTALSEAPQTVGEEDWSIKVILITKAEIRWESCEKSVVFSKYWRDCFPLRLRKMKVCPGIVPRYCDPSFCFLWLHDVPILLISISTVRKTSLLYIQPLGAF